MYSDALRQAWEARQKAISEHRSILDGIGEEPTADQSAALDKVEGELRRLDDVIEQGLDNVDREARFQEAIEKHGFAHREAPKAEAEASDEMRQVEAFLRGETRSIDFMPEVRSIGTGSGEGAATVPTSMFSEIVAGMREFSSIQNYARVITTASGEEITVPKRNTYPAAALVAEKAAYGTSEGSYTSVALNGWKFGFISQASVELLADSGFDMAAEIAAVGAEAMALGMDSYFWTGTGSSQPEGVLQNSTTTKTLAGVAAVTADEIVETVHAITRPYRANARFYMNDSTVLAVRKLKDDNGNYLWAPSRILGEPDTLLGYAVESEANLDAMATGVKSIVFGDLGKGLIVRLAGGVNVTRSDEYGFANDLVSWKWTARADSAIVDDTSDIGTSGDPVRERRALLIALIINAGFFVGELTVGLISRSIGLVADALDMGADASVYALSLAAVGTAAARKKRLARASGYVQLGLAAVGLVEVIRRFVVDTELPDPTSMIVLSALALAGNIVTLVVLNQVRSGEVHLQASWIFTANDIKVNALVITAAIGVIIFDSAIPDLIAGGFIFAVVANGARRILAMSR